MLVRLSTVTPEVEGLLVLAMYPDPARVASQLDAYRTDPARQVFGWQIGGKVVAAVGVLINGSSATIVHIGTDPAERRLGSARQLLFAIETELNLDRLVAETDEDTVGFYRRLGFEIQPLDGRFGRQRYHGVRRRG